MTRDNLILALLGGLLTVGMASTGRLPSLGSDPPASTLWPVSPKLDERTSGATTATQPPTEPRNIHHIVAGGGPLPEYNQVSIEQDLALAARLFAPGTVVLFAGGPGSHGVQVLRPKPRQDLLRAALGDLFFPRGGRDTAYRISALPSHASATPEHILDRIERALTQKGPPLSIYLAGHGDRGPNPRDNVLLLWGQTELSVARLAGALDQHPGGRTTRIVVTSCFSGGFGELVFERADPKRGPSAQLRCGLFAAPWDLPASGCDPNPDRRHQEGFGLMFLGALDGRIPGGDPIPVSDRDFDGDGRTSLLEAHSWVRIHSRSADIPTTTSERWLREMAPDFASEGPVHLPEEAAVQAALLSRLGLRHPSETEAILTRFDATLARQEELLDEARAMEDETYRKVAGELLARWPVLDDPWHPDFAATLTEARDDLVAYLDTAPSYEAFLRAADRVGTTDHALWETRRRAAPYERLHRAWENQRLAAGLERRGGKAWARYLELLACERGLPEFGAR